MNQCKTMLHQWFLVDADADDAEASANEDVNMGGGCEVRLIGWVITRSGAQALTIAHPPDAAACAAGSQIRFSHISIFIHQIDWL